MFIAALFVKIKNWKKKNLNIHQKVKEYIIKMLLGRSSEGYEETLGKDGCVNYLDCDDGFMGVYMSKLVKSYTLQTCSICCLSVILQYSCFNKQYA